MERLLGHPVPPPVDRQTDRETETCLRQRDRVTDTLSPDQSDRTYSPTMHCTEDTEESGGGTDPGAEVSSSQFDASLPVIVTVRMCLTRGLFIH